MWHLLLQLVQVGWQEIGQVPLGPDIRSDPSSVTSQSRRPLSFEKIFQSVRVMLTELSKMKRLKKYWWQKTWYGQYFIMNMGPHHVSWIKRNGKGLWIRWRMKGASPKHISTKIEWNSKARITRTRNIEQSHNFLLWEILSRLALFQRSCSDHYGKSL